jgi:hypothetical protein
LEANETRSSLLFIFIFVSLVISNRDSLLQEDITLPEKLSQMTINSTDEVDLLVHQAFYMALQTPQSFFALLQSVFRHSRIPDPSPLSDELANLVCMPISPQELVRLTVSDIPKFQKRSSLEQMEPWKRTFPVNDELLILDCRLSEEYTSGHLLNSLQIDPRLCEDELKLLDLLDELKPKQGIHICILGDGKPSSNPMAKFESKVRELLLRNNFRSISFCEGGFQDLHLYLKGAGILHQLTDHDLRRCWECNGFRSDLPAKQIRVVPASRALSLVGLTILKLGNSFPNPDRLLYFRCIDELTTFMCCELLSFIDVQLVQFKIISTSKAAHEKIARAFAPYSHVLSLALTCVSFRSIFRKDLVKGELVENAIRICEPSFVEMFGEVGASSPASNVIVVFEPILNWHTMTTVSEILDSLQKYFQEDINQVQVVVCCIVAGRSCWEKIWKFYSMKLPSLHMVCVLIEQAYFDGVSREIGFGLLQDE